ncbi:uncharacterized protein A4U43_C04F33510 [Asparagus officinalis]|uniref:Uncharacterized protein n=1 Tax=Asparagus officinalis TaxID=4686 RepID=A0A5P1FA30_ASPOF|nr:uncharacterized protein LOC109839523 isoform X7 [Asparagus officinalis]XP_020263583.1 uncharacterized protein LOC109839523 isoform X7 [Asparagus officinalis]ONK73619.1 uncharacterized protein A4U43_C04F33510 [Asparagus officinalis]
MENELATISELLTRLTVLNSNLETVVKDDYVDLIARRLEISATAGVSTDFEYEPSRLAAEYQNAREKAIQSAMYSAWETLSSEARDALKDQVDTQVHVDEFVVAAGRHVSSLEHSSVVDFAVLDNRIIELHDQLCKLSAIFRTGS